MQLISNLLIHLPHATYKQVDFLEPIPFPLYHRIQLPPHNRYQSVNNSPLMLTIVLLESLNMDKKHFLCKTQDHQNPPYNLQSLLQYIDKKNKEDHHYLPKYLQ